MGRVLIAPNQYTSQSKSHIYPTFLVSRLHNKSAGERGYNFEAVKNNDSRIDGGLEALDELYVPINVNRAHWNFIRVKITNTTIELFDLQGVNSKNNKYPQAT